VALPYPALLCPIAPSSMVCRSVCCCVILSHSEPYKTSETIKLPFGFRTRVGPMNHALHEVHKCQHSTVVCANTAELIEVPCGLCARMGPRHRVLHGVNIPHLKGQFWWIGAPIVNYGHFLSCRELCKNGLTNRFAI